MEKLKALLKARVFKITLVLFLIFVVLLPAIIYFITIDDGEFRDGDMSSTPYVASIYTSNAKFSKDGIKFFHTNKETGVEEEKTSLEMAEILWEEMSHTKNKVTDYLEKVEELQELMNAEVISQFPKIRNKNVDLNGTVEFKRYKTDNTSVMLEYIDKVTFDQYIQDGDIDIVNYFTLDENQNLLIGVVDKTTENLETNDPDVLPSDYSEALTEDDKVSEGSYEKIYYQVEQKVINYKEIISKYTMPFQYLWSLIVIGDDKDVSLELTELVKDSQIILSIYDNIKTTTNKNTYTYKRENKVNVSATAECSTNYGDSTKSGSWDPANEWKDTTEYEVVFTMIYEDNLPVIDVEKADVWIVDYSREYEYKPSENIKDEMIEPNERDLPDTEYIDADTNPVKSSSGDGSDLPNYDKFKDKLDELKNDLEQEVSQNVQLDVVNNQVVALTIDSTEIISCEASYFKHNVERHQKNETTEFQQKYIPKPSHTTPKVNKESTEDNFVTILLKPEHSHARYKITFEITSWLIELLEINPDTKNMVDLTKYLMYVITGIDRYGITEYDFSVYEGETFTNITGSIYGDNLFGNSYYGDSIQEKVWFMLKDMGYNEISIAGAMGNIHYESGSFDPNSVEGGYTEETGGIGICQWTNNNRGPVGRNTNLRAYADSKGKLWADEDIQLEFLKGELTPGGGADGYASYQLLNTKRVYGSSLACPSAWIDATNISDATMAFCYSFERPGKIYAESSRAARISYAEQYYNLYAGKDKPQELVDLDLTGDNKSKMQSMIAQAIQIAGDDRYTYSLTHRESQFAFDCASFVARLYEKFFGIRRLDLYGSDGRATYNLRENCLKIGREVSINTLQPGDIVWIPGHVALYVGDGQIAEAANSNRGIVKRGNWMVGSEYIDKVKFYRIIF